MEVIARARYVKDAPDKIRILSEVIKNKMVDEAINQLKFTGREASKSLILVLKQGESQIKQKDLQVEDFKIKSLQVDEGPKLKRRRIHAKGRSTMILKRMSHIKIVLQSDKEIKKAIKPGKEENGSKS